MLRAYECDGLTAYRAVPMAVVLPSTTAEVAAVLRLVRRARGQGRAARRRAPRFRAVPCRSSTASCSALGKLNRILDIDLENRTVTAQPGVTNLGITSAVEHAGFYYAPDPSSQIACTIGGNIAENSGGVHCLKYGLTTNNVLGLELVLPSGDIVRLGGKHLDGDGYDLMGVMTGSEGLLGVVTEVTVRILHEARDRPRRADRLSDRRAGRQLRRLDHRRRHHPGRARDDGPPGDQCRRGFRRRRLPARCRLAADLRAGRAGGRGRPADRDRGARSPGSTAPPSSRSARARRSGCASGPDARTPSRRSAGSRRTISAWTARSRAASSPMCCSGCARCRSTTGCASPTSSTPATATCIR